MRRLHVPCPLHFRVRVRVHARARARARARVCVGQAMATLETVQNARYGL